MVIVVSLGQSDEFEIFTVCKGSIMIPSFNVLLAKRTAWSCWSLSEHIATMDLHFREMLETFMIQPRKTLDGSQKLHNSGEQKTLSDDGKARGGLRGYRLERRK